MRPEATKQLSIFLLCFSLFPWPFVFNRFPASSEQRQCSNNVSPLKAGACNTSRLPNRPWVLHHTQKQRNTTSLKQSCPTAVGTMVHQMSQGDLQGWPPSLRPHLPFHHSEGPGRRKPGHGRGWCGRPAGLRAGRTRVCAGLRIQSPPLECTKFSLSDKK